ncbi:ciliogenesis and planar polarity effector 2 [Dryobates pubescens]|uniref:ciliogenesis and planar polarity effector 2 n=1 Tax=Dryobates pubescens TaxID=118200 RepID=UPI0023B90F54|nr:ciliogenesis and planar polarity effector 2 [Dryobates pubescens]
MDELEDPELELEPEWLCSPAGRRYLRCILHKNRRRTFGVLESPALPPSSCAATIPYKLFVCGKSGVGKTALVAMLAGVRVPPTHYETRGTEVTTVYWPAKPLSSTDPVMFQLNLWDCGDGVLRKFDYLLPSCKESVDAILFLFSFTDRSSFEELPAQMSRLLGPGEENVLRVVIGTKFDLVTQAAVTEEEVKAFGRSWGLQVLRVGCRPGPEAELGVCRVAPTLNSLVARLWRRDRAAAHAAPAGTPPS